MSSIEKYAASWRILHWLMALMVLTLIPVGLWMTARGESGSWGSLTDTLYSGHKVLGFTVLLLMILRIGIKIRFRTPPYPDSLPRLLRIAATSVHHLIYVFLVLTPLFGWAGVTAFPALVTFGGVALPAMPLVPQSEALAERLFAIHGVLALSLGVLVAGHILAALRHLLRRDGIFSRML